MTSSPASPPIRIRAMTPDDVPAAQRLREQAGWNQTDDDWRRLLAWEPTGCWVAELDGRVVASTTVTTYGTRIAWIGMVLVDEAHRRRGIGKRMLAHAHAYLDAAGVQTIALDATPAGRLLYETLGYRERYGLERWRGTVAFADAPSPDLALPNATAPVATATTATSPDANSSDATDSDDGAVRVRSLDATDLPAVARYDAPVFGIDRAHILGALCSGDAPGAGDAVGTLLAERAGTIVGYALRRPGTRAVHLGPLVADDAPTAELLARAALGDHAGEEAVMDVVTGNADAVALAERLGLAPVRPFIRMTRGADPPSPNLDRLYTSAGPEIG